MNDLILFNLLIKNQYLKILKSLFKLIMLILLIEHYFFKFELGISQLCVSVGSTTILSFDKIR
jgi:hypothetical protein